MGNAILAFGLAATAAWSETTPVADIHTLTLGAGLFGAGLMLGFVLAWFILAQSNPGSGPKE